MSASSNRSLVSKRGKLTIVDVPRPTPNAEEVIIRVQYSAVSPGTESTIRSTTSSTAIVKAASLKASEAGRQTLNESIKRFLKVWKGVQPLGYSVIGEVVQVGESVIGLEKGDKVVATGAGFAVHADYVTVPSIYVVPVPKISPQLALSGVMTIGINAVSKVSLQVSDRVLIFGGGTIGWLTALVCRMSGADVTIVDPEERVRAQLAEQGFRCLEAVPNEIESTHVMICTDTASTMADAQACVQYGGAIVIVGYGDIVIDRELLELKQFKLACVDAYGLGANHRAYNRLNIDQLADEYALPTARTHLQRAAYCLQELSLKRHIQTMPISDYGSLESRQHNDHQLGIILDWKG